MSWLLHLYPPAWKRRYLREVKEHLDAERTGLRTAFDLMAGAVDAWRNPDAIPRSSVTEEDIDMVTASRCRSAAIGRTEALKGALTMIGISLVLTGLAVLLDMRKGQHILVDALLNSSFFIALSMASRDTYLKPYSRAARNAMVLVAIPAWYLFFLGVAALRTLL